MDAPVATEARAGWWGLKPVLLAFAPQLALAPALFFVGVTFLHEAAHAAMALALGGRVTEFAFLPGLHNLGHVRWEPPAHAPLWTSDLVSVAPYLMWSLLAAATIVLAWRRLHVNRWVAAAIFFWGYFVPVGDIAWNLYGGQGDLALGGVNGIFLQSIGTAALLAAFAIGYPVQRRLFRARALDVRGYLACALLIGAASAVAAGIGLYVFARLA